MRVWENRKACLWESLGRLKSKPHQSRLGEGTFFEASSNLMLKEKRPKQVKYANWGRSLSRLGMNMRSLSAILDYRTNGKKLKINFMSIHYHFWSSQQRKNHPPTINLCCNSAFPHPNQPSKYPNPNGKEEERIRKAFVLAMKNHILLALIILIELRINGRLFRRWIDARSLPNGRGIHATTGLQDLQVATR